MKPYYEDALVTLYHGDSREVGNWLQADALVTDPPYGVRFRPRYVADGSRTQGNRDRHEDRIIGDGDTSIRDEILTRWGDRPWVVFGSWRRPLDKAHTRLTWEKGIQAGMGNWAVPWRPNTEDIYLGGRWPKREPGPRFSAVISGIRQYVPGEHARPDHPTPKPTALLENILARLPEAWCIADPFAGSGPTLIAAAQLGRRAIGVEIEERYCELTASRLQNMDHPLLDVLYPPASTNGGA